MCYNSTEYDYVKLTGCVVEWGSFDPMLGSFMPTQFIGTTNSTVCVTGYDQTAFIAGTSSNIFNEANFTGEVSHDFLFNLIVTEWRPRSRIYSIRPLESYLNF